MKTSLSSLTFLLLIMQNTFAIAQLRGKVSIDGSSTVFPITEAIAEEFRSVQPRVKVNIGVSGTGGGFKKFLKGETDINNASRPIKITEVGLAKENKIEYMEIPVAYDGITVVMNKDNDFVDFLTTEELKKIWDKDSQVKTWKDVRKTWPDKPIKLYGPGTDSGTFDYFTEEINGQARRSRSDFQMSEDDNVLVNGVVGDKFSLGYFGFSYYNENKKNIKAVPIKSKNGVVVPSIETINSGKYFPLSRPIFIYVNKLSLTRAEVKEYVNFYLKNATSIVKDVGYVPLPSNDYILSLSKIK
ncbi:MAG: PstS family phosphate ABC transporter substrate-binding protein [Halobacteriovoraceae bacterium]|nr:PstS family phosphate ABC transporter substrate-binding protein [Halobacteriovoraceae bacterium]